MAVVAVLLGAGLQAATGFGFALVAAPLLVATLGAEEAVSTAVLLSVGVNALTLLRGRGESAVLRAEARRLLAWAAPGLVAGAVVLATLSDGAITVIVAAGVIGGLAVRLHTRRGPVAAPRERLPATAAAAGLSAGVLTTATSLNGPPLVLHLAGTRATAAEVRDTLALVLGALGLAGLGVLAVAGTFALPEELPLLAVAAAVGHVAGRPLLGVLAGERYERAVTAVLAATAVTAAISAL